MKWDPTISTPGENFRHLWTEIVSVITYWDYIGLANEIDSYQMDRLITEQHEQILLAGLEQYVTLKNIRKPIED